MPFTEQPHLQPGDHSPGMWLPYSRRMTYPRGRMHRPAQLCCGRCGVHQRLCRRKKKRGVSVDLGLKDGEGAGGGKEVFQGLLLTLPPSPCSSPIIAFPPSACAQVGAGSEQAAGTGALCLPALQGPGSLIPCSVQLEFPTQNPKSQPGSSSAVVAEEEPWPGQVLSIPFHSHLQK